jgi:hypothetical protein
MGKERLLQKERYGFRGRERFEAMAVFTVADAVEAGY